MASTLAASGVGGHVQADVPCLPSGTDAEFVGEGAANVVFAINIPINANAEDRHVFQGKLLRMPKAGKGTFPYVEQQAFWESQVRPLFRPEDLVNQSLIRMPEDGGGFIARLNKILSEKDPERRDDFVGSRVEDVDHGMLVEDMRSRGDGDVIREFKPKWLAQSPNAPETAVRCRNCAREALRNVKKGRAAPIFCPLNFLASDTRQSVKVLRYFNLPTTFTPGLSQTKHCYEWLGEKNVLKILRENQTRLDPKGPLNVSAHDDAFQLAMTLRDCTVYLKIPKEPGQPICAKLGDLDKKNWDVKLDYWRAMEKDLKDGGFYEARETPLQETDCTLVAARIGDFSSIN